jgi:type III secretory pathway lipoprotein EscJ
LVVAAALYLGACAQETIAHQQTERDANRIVKLLRDRGIEAAKAKDEDSRELAFNILVPQTAAHDSLSILEEHNLPKQMATESKDLLEGGMIPTPEQQLMKKTVALRGDIINALRDLPRVVDVKVVASIPAENPLRDPNEEPPRPKVSVIIVYQPDEAGAPPLTQEDVQKFAYAAVPEIKSAEVSVMLTPSTLEASGNGKTPGGKAIAPPNPRTFCKKEGVIGMEVCEGNKKKVVNLLLGAIIVAGVLAGMAVIAVLRAMRYRKDLTRLTAQFQQHRK